MRTLYSLLYAGALAALLPRELLKRPRGQRLQWLREKTGRFHADTATDAPCIWIHAVSVGETIAAVPFVRELQRRYPEHTFIVSTITDTGRAVAQERFGDSVTVLYLPFDLGSCLRRAFRRVRPSAFIIMETELWPGLIGVLHDEHIPVFMVNGRISEKSFEGYRKVSGLFHRTLDQLTHWLVQEQLYADRVLALGVPPERVTVTGSFKFDIDLPQRDVPWAALLSGPVVVAGSTHEGEEDVIVSACVSARQSMPDLNLIIAPRHPHRFDRVADILRQKGVYFIRRSELDAHDTSIGTLRSVVVLLDTVGELSGVFRAADIAIMGGTFIPHGGQNPLEAAYWGKPVLCGPSMENFPFIESFYRQGAALAVTRQSLATELSRLLADPDGAAAMGARARGILEHNRGAVARAVEIISGTLDIQSGGHS